MSDLPGRFTTSLLEFLVAGLLAGASLVTLFFSLFPSDTEAFAARTGDLAEGVPSIAASLLIVTGVAVALGIVFEYLSRVPFEWRLDRIKDERLPKFVREVSERVGGAAGNVDVGSEMLRSHGEMRFFVLMRSPPLYGEIDLQIVRMRLTRVLAVCEVIWAVAAVLAYARDPRAPVFLICVLLVGAIVVTVLAVGTQFRRYCRAIERSYLVLLLPSAEGAAAGGSR